MVRIAIIDKKKCHPDECQNLCLKKCPVNKMGEECITLDAGKAHISEPLCVGCGICPRICPFGALDIINLPEELEEPIHRYGENQFALYNLPVPLFGKVVGLLGRNGIGKSTAMQILAGVLQPNFGDFSDSAITLSKEEAYTKLINYFKGSEAQAYFEKLKKEEIVISFKPQQVELIPKTYSGTVDDLLTKINEQSQERFEEIIHILEIKHILSRDITHVSGGELQRVAIAACVLKKANVYFFDEPTSYLDIKQRLKVANFIRTLADEQTAVMVIEHDLIILDHVTDYVHLLYGKESGYGIVSGVKATKNGINTYLSGFLKEENVRFRDHEITFDGSASEEAISIRELFSWNNFSSSYGDFSLHVNEGKLFAHDVVGILGENGIGKTSLVKEWVKAAKDLQDKEAQGEDFTPQSPCEITPNETIKDLKVAYKPQYIPVSDEIVRLYLKDALKYEIQLIRPLHVEHLLDKQLDQLSGGELQRVVIAHTLAQDAHIYFLDEPSAYLDVEQRLSLSKVIREMMDIKRGSAFVVDHDLLVIDYISKRLLVFDGQPAIRGESKGPFSMREGMNEFLQDLNITFRRDENNNRPRVNKLDSQKDKEQKASGNLYYAD